MAKPLNTAPPSSSVSRLLDEQAVTRALAPKVASVPRDPVLRPQSPRTLVKREFILDGAAAAMMDELLSVLRSGTATRLSASHALRAVLMALAPALPALAGSVERAGPWRLPGNGADHEHARHGFEQRLAVCIRASVPPGVGHDNQTPLR